jgi:hypothetical protein
MGHEEYAYKVLAEKLKDWEYFEELGADVTITTYKTGVYRAFHNAPRDYKNLL